MSKVNNADMPSMNSRAGAIISAHTGILCCEFSEMHKYIEEVMEGPVFTHQLGNSDFVEIIKERSKDDFMHLIKSQQEKGK